MRWALLVGLHAVVWALVLWATSPEGDCTKSGDCPRNGEGVEVRTSIKSSYAAEQAATRRSRRCRTRRQEKSTNTIDNQNQVGHCLGTRRRK